MSLKIKRCFSAVTLLSIASFFVGFVTTAAAQEKQRSPEPKPSASTKLDGTYSWVTEYCKDEIVGLPEDVYLKLQNGKGIWRWSMTLPEVTCEFERSITVTFDGAQYTIKPASEISLLTENPACTAQIEFSKQIYQHFFGQGFSKVERYQYPQGDKGLKLYPQGKSECRFEF